MKAIHITNLIIHILLSIASCLLIVLPGSGLLVSTALSFIGFSSAEASSPGFLLISAFLLFYSFFSFILGILNICAFTKNPKTYTVIELVLAGFGIVGLFASLFFFMSSVNFIIRYLIHKIILLIDLVILVMICLCILNLVLTLLFSNLSRKKRTADP